MEIGNNLKNLRNAKGMTQKDLANTLNVSSQAVSRWENDEVEPDLDAISKMASIFDVSIDEIINSKKFEKKEKKYRNVFVSGKRFYCSEHADADNGYIKGIKKINEQLITVRNSVYDLLIKNNGYSKTFRFQFDLNACLFLDEKKKIFGVVFENEEHFVCPFENFVNFTFSDSGNSTGHTETSIVGAGIGKTNSIIVGSIPTSQTNLPNLYNVVITYFNEKGEIQTYTIQLSCFREYIWKNKLVNSMESFYFWKDGLSSNTESNLNLIKSSLEAVKLISKSIESGKIDVEELSFSDRKVYDSREELLKSLSHNETTDDNDLKIKIGKYILGFVFALLLIVLMIFLVAKVF